MTKPTYPLKVGPCRAIIDAGGNTLAHLNRGPEQSEPFLAAWEVDELAHEIIRLLNQQHRQSGQDVHDTVEDGEVVEV